MATLPKIYSQHSLSDPPAPGSKTVGSFVQALFEEAKQEKIRLELPDRWRNGYALRAGHHFRNGVTTNRARPKMMFNLIFSFIERTVANLTSRTPVAEAKPIGGAKQVEIVYNEETETLEWNVQEEGEAEAVGKPLPGEQSTLLNTVIKQWWTDTEQNRSLKASANKMETYGCTWEKHTFDFKRGTPVTRVIDCFSVFPQPGNWTDVSTQPAYFIHAYPVEVSRAQEIWGNKDIVAEEKYDLLGQDRDRMRVPRNLALPGGSVSHFPNDYTNRGQGSALDRDRGNCLVVECWIRDEKNTWTDADGNKRPYPGGIRVIQTCNDGKIVLSDMSNPNINDQMPEDLARNTYGWDHFPFSVGVSYHDDQSIWGLSAPEQVGDIQLRINELLTRLLHYLNLMVWPILIIPRDTGIKPSDVNNRAGAVLRPFNSVAANSIRFLQPAHLTDAFWRAYNTLVDMFGRIYAIEDIDRGEAPGNIVAASAISALQERNAVLMRHKVGEMDYLVRERGRFAISSLQNFGIYPQDVDIDGEIKLFRGIEFSAQKYNYVVESGSAVTRTNQQDTEVLMSLWREKVVLDRRDILEPMDIPNKRAILEHIGEDQLGIVADILTQSGYQEGMPLPDGTPAPSLQSLLSVLAMPQLSGGGRPRPGRGNPESHDKKVAMSPAAGATAAPTPRPPVSEQGMGEE